MPHFSVTYDVVTEESARQGDVVEQGFIAHLVTLRTALDIIEGDGCYVEADSSPLSLEHPPRWFTFYDVNEGSREWFETDRRESRTLHLPESITPSSAMRLARALDCYGI